MLLAVANAATVAATGGIDSPIVAACMYVGWIGAVVVPARSAFVMAAAISSSVFAGYLLAGASLADILTGPARYGALSNAFLPIFAGIVGGLLATVTNSLFGRLPEAIQEFRSGAWATTPALTALLAGRQLRALPTAPLDARSPAGSGAALTGAECEVVALLADGHRPKQIARLRGVALSTVRSQIKAAKEKTGARTIDELVAIGWDGGRERD
jgi:DNA-binding CsgD family transcriptional regulator